MMPFSSNNSTRLESISVIFVVKLLVDNWLYHLAHPFLGVFVLVCASGAERRERVMVYSFFCMA
jgi:hypothetical protein